MPLWHSLWFGLIVALFITYLLTANITADSTLVGQGLDSLVFVVLAFAGTSPVAGLALAILTQWLVKTAYESAVTPLTYVVVAFLKRHEGVDVYDYDTRFNSLLVGE